MKSSALLATAVVLGLALSACSSGHGSYSPPPAAPPTASPVAISNRICPVMGEPVDPSVPTSVYKGRVIGFCCGGCKPKFDANPEAYAGNIR